MRVLLIISCCILNGLSFGQSIGINASSQSGDNSSGLDVSFDDKGILIPRVSLLGINDLTTINAPASGIIVYNTATNGTAPNNVIPGYYYFNGVNWSFIQPSTGPGTEWSLYGNSGTNVLINYIGTADNNDLIFKRNSVISGKLSLSTTCFGGVLLTTIGNGNCGFGSGSIGNTSVSTVVNNVGFGFESLKNAWTNCGANCCIGSGAGRNIGVTSNNVGLGVNSIGSAWNGSFNVGIGAGAGQSRDIGNSCCNIGYNACSSSASGSGIVGIGSSAMKNCITTGSIGIGTNSGQFISNGLANIAIGCYSQGALTTGSRNVSFGYLAISSSIVGSDQTAVGRGALGAGGASPLGTRNNALGLASLGGVVSGANNVGIGIQAGQNISSGSNNIVIGAYIPGYSMTADNFLNINNYIYGQSGKLSFGNDGTGPSLSSISLTIKGTDAVIVPVGTTAQRPSSPSSGMIRFNTDLGKYEGYDGTTWVFFY